MLNQKVEVGFDLTSTGGPFLTLDDPVAGRLDSVDWVLGGTLFYDITDDVREIQITRGKSTFIENISSGEAVVELNNRSRAYDPTYEDSPYFGNIVPKREVRISTNGEIIYTGVVDDWNLAYEANGDALATFVASDALVYFNNQTLAAGTATVQTSGARVNAILDSEFVNWPTNLRRIDDGVSTLGADVIPEDTNVLSYLQQVERSEFGTFFVSKDGYAVFQDRTVAPTSDQLVEFADDGSGVPYQNLQVVYGSEQLHNEVVVSSVITASQVVATDIDSQNAYGIFNLTLNDLLVNSDLQLENLATYLVALYSQPTFRFESMDVRLNDLTEAQALAVLGLEIGSVIKLTFTPSDLPPAIVKYAQVIRMTHNVNLTGEHYVTLGMNTLDFTYFVVGDAVFGRLDSDNALGF